MPCHLLDLSQTHSTVVEHYRMKAWIRQRIDCGDSIIGTYPPDEKTQTEHLECLTHQSRRGRVGRVEATWVTRTPTLVLAAPELKRLNRRGMVQ